MKIIVGEKDGNDISTIKYFKKVENKVCKKYDIMEEI